MFTHKKLYLVLPALMLMLLSLLISPAAAQKSDSNAKKKKKIAAKSTSGKTKKKTAKPTREVTLSTTGDRRRKIMGEDEEERERRERRGQQTDKDSVKSSRKATEADSKEIVNDQPTESKLTRAGTFDGDLRKLPYSKSIFKEVPERESPYEDEILEGDPVEIGSGLPFAPSAAAPSPASNFIGLDFNSFGSGRPPDTNGDVGPTYFLQSVNASLGIFRKSDGARVVGVNLNTFMSQGNFGNLCDTNNFGDPVVLYDSFEDRWIVTDFAFTLDASGNVTSNSFQCFAASKTGDPVTGGWNYYSTVDTDFLGDYPKFGVWNDGIYMSANMFGKAAGGSFQTVRVRALNKSQMYAGTPTVQVVSFDVGGGEFTILPANARLQTGTPPAGSPNYMAVVALYTNAVSVYKFKVDWNRVSTSTITGPSIVIAPASWSTAPTTVPAMGGNANDTLATRLMVQNQYTNIGGVESLWDSHTVQGSTTAQSAVRYYQVNVTGGNVAATTTQATTHNPDTTNRYMPSVGLDRMGDMALGYSASSSTLMPAIRYAGRLSTDPVNTLPQTENTLINGTGAQNTSTRWGDYSTMTLDPDGCSFWLTNEYYAAVGGNWQTRIGSFAFPGCSPLSNNGTLQGTVTSLVTGLPINGATVTLGSRTTTTNSSGVYSFANVPSGTYLTDTASATGYDPSTTTNLAIADAAVTTQNFALSTAVASACLTDSTQSELQTGIPTNTDLTTNPGDVILVKGSTLNQQNTTLSTSGVVINATTWGGQTFTPTITGPLTRADIALFCSACTGTTPNLILSVRATSGGFPVGADLASATIAGFNSGSNNYYTGTFSSPATVNAGTVYALVIRAVSNPSAGTYALTRSATNVYANGQRVNSADSGATWSAPLTGAVTTDAGFRTYIDTGYSLTGTFESSIKDANPVVASTTTWTTLSWTATTPSNTSLNFQVAASNNPNGPFNFVGPNGTPSTFFTTSGSSLSQFNGLRYLKYKAYLATTNNAVTPTLSDVTVCYTNPRVWTGAVSSDWNNAANWSASGVPGATDKAIIPATGITNNPTNTTNNTVGSLQLDAGIIDTGANTLTVTTCSPSAVSGGSANSYVKGSLTRCVNNTGIFNFPVGTANGYSPVSLNNIVGTGNFNVNPVQAFLAGTSNSQSLQKYWGLTPDSGVNQADLTLNYLDADVPGTATENAFQFIRRSGTFNTAFAPSSADTAANRFTLNGVSSFSDWTLGVNAPTAASVSVTGRVIAQNGRGIANAIVTLQASVGKLTRNARTNSSGYYRFDDVPVGQSYIMSASSKSYKFQSRVISPTENLSEIDFVANSTNLTERTKP